jgi:hypothetical protein
VGIGVSVSLGALSAMCLVRCLLEAMVHVSTRFRGVSPGAYTWVTLDPCLGGVLVTWKVSARCSKSDCSTVGAGVGPGDVCCTCETCGVALAARGVVGTGVSER